MSKTPAQAATPAAGSGPPRTDDAARRSLIRASTVLSGADYVEVDTLPEELNQRRLRLYLLAPDPPDDVVLQAKCAAMLELLAATGNEEMAWISGGVRVTGIRITARTVQDGALVLEVNEPGDFSDYVLHLEAPGLDPFFSTIAFSFKAGCPRRFDCAGPAAPEPVHAEGPHIDYLAKDYDSFRQGMLDLLPVLIPDWDERRIPDVGIELLELFAFIGDRLSYRQDAVANEAYLETARQRVSVRRHTRLIDYPMHDGLSSMLLLCVGVAADIDLSTRTGVILQALRPDPADVPAAPVIPAGAAAAALGQASAVFEVLSQNTGPFALGTPGMLYQRHNTIDVHTFSLTELMLPAGTTTADLAGDLSTLHAGDLLLLEEIRDPETGEQADADASHRQAVRLTEVAPAATDPLTGTAYTRVRWAGADALSFDLVICGSTGDGVSFTGGAVARGNLLPAFAGRSATQRVVVPLPIADPRIETPPDPRHLTIALQAAPLGFLPGTQLATLSVAALQRPDPGLGIPAVMTLRESSPGAPDRSWGPVTGDLLDSGPFDRAFVVETANDGSATLRFGDGIHGALPSPGSTLEIDYRIGNGATGNVGAETLTHFVAEPWLNDVLSVRNPLPAFGGTSAQSSAAVKALAPAALTATTYRAVTAADYALRATGHPDVFAASARFRYTGSWQSVMIYVQPRHGMGVDPALAAELTEYVGAVALAGYDLAIKSPLYAPLMLSLHLCPAPGYLGPEVEQAVAARLTGGADSYFAPGAFGFGEPLYLSSLLAAVQQVPGVASLSITSFTRRFDADPQATAVNLARGYIPAAELEVLRLDNNPDFPENGILEISSGG